MDHRLTWRLSHCTAGILLLVVAACQGADQVTQPATWPPIGAGPSLSWSTPASGSPSIDPVSTRYGDGGISFKNHEYAYPVATVVRIDVSGNVAQSSHYPIPTSATNGPGGNAVVGTWSPGNVYNSYVFGGNSADSATTMYLTMTAGSEISSVSRKGYGNDSKPGVIGTDGSTVWCGPPYTTDYCYTYSGHTAFTITPLTADLDVQQDSTIVASGSAVTLTIKASPSVKEGYTMPVQLDSVGWTPDSGTTGTLARGACAATAGPPIKCTRTITQSGTLHVIAHVNGRRLTDDKHVAIRNRALTLSASPASVHRPTDTVTFTPRWADGYPLDVRGWQWVPDSGADGNTQPCLAGQSPCRTEVWKSGHMVVTVYREGQDYTANASVAVVPCLTGDPWLDNPAVREAMWRSWRDSGAETQSNPENRHENLFAVYKNSVTGVETVVQIPTPNATACEVSPNSTVTIDTVLPNGDKLEALIHPHPMPYNSLWPANCGPEYNGTRYEEPVIFGFGPEGTGRASAADWGTSKELRVPVVIVDFETATVINGKNANITSMLVNPSFPSSQYTIVLNGNEPSVRTELPRNAGSCPTH